MRISLLIHNIYGLGGTNRTSINLASALADRHEVEIVSVYRYADRPLFAIDPRVRVVSLIDIRTEQKVGLRAQRSEVFPESETRYAEYSRLSDQRVAEYFARTDPDVAIGTRPGLNLYVARMTGERTLRIGQEHVTLASHAEELRAEMGRHYGRLHAFVTVTEADAANFRTLLPLPGVRVEAVPNSVPAPAVPVSDGRSKVVVAAGRLAAVKRYDQLVEAFAKVVADYPDWQLRIYGKGGQRGRLRALIDELGLGNNVLLPGLAMPIEAEWVKGSIAAVTSESESFGMTLVEAMRCGLPVLSTDCPLGPGEIIRDGEDGRLIAPGDVDAIAAGLMELIGDDELRGRMAAAAWRNAARFDPAVIAQRYERMFEELRRELGLDLPTRAAAEPARPADRWPADTADPEPPRSSPRLGARPGRRPAVALLRRLVAVPARWLLRTPATAATVGAAVQDRTGASLYASGSDGITIAFPAASEQDTLLLRRRGGKRTTIRVPVRPAEPGGSADALIEPRLRLPDGTWDLHIERPSGVRSRVGADLLDLRELIGARPPVSASPVTARLPYRTADGFLALRVWEQPTHAEVERIGVAEGTITVTARLFGTAARPDHGLLRHRSRAGLSIEVRCVPLPDGTVELTLPCALPAAEHTAEEDYWDLFVQVSGLREPVRVGGWFDDIRVRKGIHVHPVTVVDDTPRGRARVRPYFNDDNGLSVNVVDLPPSEAAEPSGRGGEPAASAPPVLMA
ncbi:glycosyltransferase family 4 protein [Streptacidiphilus cavernicola]|uniref:D-inositol 3-phosphate glycosyltransferase n=1 Tax=Streptacidiphilus cavernicola TaxID=3342716 RepID=A0ABV6VTE1_9ACTN